MEERTRSTAGAAVPLELGALYEAYADMNGWGRYTDKNCEVVSFSGGHFYYIPHKEEVCKLICKKLELN